MRKITWANVKYYSLPHLERAGRTPQSYIVKCSKGWLQVLSISRSAKLYGISLSSDNVVSRSSAMWDAAAGLWVGRYGDGSLLKEFKWWIEDIRWQRESFKWSHNFAALSGGWKALSMIENSKHYELLSGVNSGGIPVGPKWNPAQRQVGNM